MRSQLQTVTNIEVFYPQGHKVIRIDGTITSTAERQHLINTFQTDSSYTCFLLTTQVCGVCSDFRYLHQFSDGDTNPGYLCPFLDTSGQF